MSFFNCLNPIYTLNDLQKKTCPPKRAMVFSMLAFIIVLIIGIIYYNSVKTKYNNDIKMYEMEMKMYEKKMKMYETELKLIESTELEKPVKPGKPVKPQFSKIITTIIIVGILISIIVYFLTIFLFNISVTQNNSMIDNYVNMGMTRQEAIREIARIRQTQQIANAARSRR